MEHLSLAELSDYARGLRSDVNAHVAACADCSNSIALLRRVKDAALTVDVPSEVVEEAVAIFGGGEAQQKYGGFRQALARLVFLQTGEQQLAGVRSSQPAARQALYRFEDYCVDLRCEAGAESIRTSLVGQIANERYPLAPMADVPVSLFAGKRVLKQTRCNGLGEFAMDFVPNRRLRLKFDLTGEELSIEVPLRDLSEES